MYKAVMALQDRNTTQLPRQLLEELNIPSSRFKGQSSRNSPAARKEQRKAERAKRKHPPLRIETKPPQNRTREKRPVQLCAADGHGVTHHDSGDGSRPLKSILKGSKASSTKDSRSQTRLSRSAQSSVNGDRPKLSRGVRDKLATDDAEIAALEKALGMKQDSKLPKAFEEDGLDVLLDGMSPDEEAGQPGKRKRADYDNYLATKRRQSKQLRAGPTGGDRIGLQDPSGESSVDDMLENPFSSDEESAMDEADQTSEDLFEGFTYINQTAAPVQTIRENPYVAPVRADQLQKSARYVPPSLRTQSEDNSEDITRLRRQTQGLLNRLSEDNMLSILSDVEKLYASNPRHHVSTVLLDLLISLFCDATSLQNTFVILHAGFIAAIFKVVSVDFGPQMLERIDVEFMKHYSTLHVSDYSSKQALNLVSVLSMLYTFEVITSALIYDYIRLFLCSFSEANAELLLKLLSNSGTQLRQDDSTSLKDIITLLSSAVAEKGEENLSVRTKFMIETIHNLRNNKMKTGYAASAITSAHTIRMKKALGSLNQSRTLKASEPLNISLQDLRNTDKRGRWWLVGASYRDPSTISSAPASQQAAPQQDLPQGHNESSQSQSQLPSRTDDRSFSRAGTPLGPDLHTLALQNRMTTPVRQAIFIALMSAEDYTDAYTRLQKLNLRNRQREEIPKVLLHCAGAEGESEQGEGEVGGGGMSAYNPYYALVARRLCQGDKKMKVGMRFALWGLWSRINGDQDSDDDDDGYDGREAGQTVPLHTIVHTAKLYGNLVAEGVLGLELLKTVDLMALRSEKLRIWLEVFFITVILAVLQCESSARERNDSGNGESGGGYTKDDKSRLVKCFIGNSAMAMQKHQQETDDATAAAAAAAAAADIRGATIIRSDISWFLKKVVRKTDIAGGKPERKAVRWGCRVLGDFVQEVLLR